MPTHYEGGPDEVRALNTFIKLSRASNTVDSAVARSLSEYHLTPSQFGALEVLYHLGPMCLGELGGKILKSSGNMTLVIDNLEKRGLVQRERDEVDRRQVYVSLTDEGRALIGGMFQRHAQMLTTLFGVLTPDEQDELGRLCKKLGTQPPITEH